MVKLLENLRRYFFWLDDFLRGQPVKTHLDEISLILDDGSAEDSHQLIEHHLKNLLQHIVSRVPYYKSYKGIMEFSSFPVVNKQVIKSQRDMFLATDNDSRKTIAVTTSGSTGTPFETFQDKNKKLRNTADTLFFAERGGYKLGQRLIYLKIWVQEKMGGKLKYWLQNLVPVDVIKLNDSHIELLLNKISRDRSTVGILGYASALELICKYLDRHPDFIVGTNVKSAISMSETLNEYTKDRMYKHFGVNVVSRYSNLENGILAQQERDGSGNYLVNTASYIIEILKMDSDQPADEGEPGRIVVTDLFNYALPMIRYDTGDVGAMVPAVEGDPRRYLSVVEGRKLDLIFDTKGELVSSYIVYKNMWQYTEISQYQLIQEDKNVYTFKINAAKEFLKEEKLISEFKNYLGDDAKFTVEYVDEIPLLASGKRKKIVNNYIKT